MVFSFSVFILRFLVCLKQKHEACFLTYRREPGNDWVILALGFPGIIEKVEIDTAHFKGNYPDRAAIQAALLTDADLGDMERASEGWPILLPESKLDMDQQHYFTDELAETGAVSHVRLSIFPDGGVSRLRLFGRVAGDDK